MRTGLSISVLLLAASPALAHRLHVDAKVAGDLIRVEAFYDDDTPAQEAKITLTLGDQLAVEGRTDDKGVWTCPRPAPGTYTVRAVSVGHAAKDSHLVPEPEPTQATIEQEPPASPERVKQTRTPWARLAAGLAIIGGLWVAWTIARRSTGMSYDGSEPSNDIGDPTPSPPGVAGGEGRGEGG